MADMLRLATLDDFRDWLYKRQDDHPEEMGMIANAYIMVRRFIAEEIYKEQENDG